MPWKPDRFSDLIPTKSFDLSGIARGLSKSAAIEAAYDEGFCGAFLTSDSGPLGRAARYYRDEFRDNAGANQWSFQLTTPSRFPNLLSPTAPTEYGYIASVDAFRAWKRDKASDAQDWLFKTLQNSGCCVGVSGTEMLQGFQGTRAMDPSTGEAMSYVGANWQYSFRGYCGAGWYGSKFASVTMEHGYCFALPKILSYIYGGEQDSEDYCTSRWCRGGPPGDICKFVDDHGWRFEPGAITEFDGGVQELKALGQLQGQFHHGSNVTSGARVPDVLKSIGGHQQTMYGISWHPLIIKFYESKGYKLESDDAWTFNHQTWGPGFSGEIHDGLYPFGHDDNEGVYSWAEAKEMTDDVRDQLTQLAGPKPEGAWVCSASKILKNVRGYAYLPKFKGLSGSTPPPPPSGIALTGELYVEGGTVIRGELKASGNGNAEFIVVPSSGGKYTPVRKVV